MPRLIKLLVRLFLEIIRSSSLYQAKPYFVRVILPLAGLAAKRSRIKHEIGRHMSAANPVAPV
jgi:hypothetical protein